ncbi:MAG: dihydroxyacetone kinase subunit DhaK, partial [Steroidobacteraceae bacterium]
MRMKKFINRRERIVSELLDGLVLCHPDKVRRVGDNLIARARPKTPGKVGIVTLGGSGHEPGLSGFVGEGLLDVSVAGEIFAAPGAPGCLAAIRLADAGAGVLFIVLNHAGDVLSASITLE